MGNFSPNFLETEKAMQNDKKLEFVSTERIRKKKKNWKIQLVKQKQVAS